MNISDIEKNVKEFNLEEFYLNNLNGGFIIISPKQTLGMYNDGENHSGMHGEKIEKLYQVMYPGFKNFKDHIWFYPEALEMGSIVITLMSGDYLTNIVAIPQNINQRQYEEFENFANYIEDINSKLAENNRPEITFVGSDCVKMEESYNSLSDILKALEDRIVFDKKPSHLEAFFEIKDNILEGNNIKINR